MDINKPIFYLVAFAIIIINVNFCHSQNDLKERAVISFNNSVNELLQALGQNKTESIEDTEKRVKLLKIISSPLNETNFYLFEYGNKWDHMYKTYFKNDSTLGRLFLEKDDENKIISDSLIIQVNSLLKYEHNFNSKKLLNLLNFILNKVSVDNYPNSVIILNRWSEIRHDNKNKIPDSIKLIISPPKYINHKKSAILLYCWKINSGNLYKIYLDYYDKNVKIDQTFIGKYGKPKIRLIL
jgi:hypothetical protein